MSVSCHYVWREDWAKEGGGIIRRSRQEDWHRPKRETRSPKETIQTSETFQNKHISKSWRSHAEIRGNIMQYEMKQKCRSDRQQTFSCVLLSASFGIQENLLCLKTFPIRFCFARQDCGRFVVLGFGRLVPQKREINCKNESMTTTPILLGQL